MKSPTLVFVHGWGQSAQTWHAQMDYFGERHHVLAVNLPGHGGAPDAALETWEDALLAKLPSEPVVFVGWSLGGMLGQRLATTHAARLAGLVLLSTTPRFRLRPDWEYGCTDEVFERFRDSLKTDAPRLLDRFFALMLQGDALDRKQYLGIVRTAIDRRHPASPDGLHCGLQLLDELDLRTDLPGISLPALVVHGAADTVTPVGAAHYLAAQLPAATLRIMQAGHAPHLTQPLMFNELLEEWCQNNISTQLR
ncbi:MAG: response regulator [Zetaproteobacteria bacterium CG12_big_fil_rev_8_21_14_0_65_55_1124]|nr:MAG: response regulator [Zetaproteobacteria bacterium CG08_land_8_20_14_0_20_55_17]PIW42847.1 MAG: response regulator [Zetaproteobacteria bacterium CG12_big_fil_rev_8_21_14_0_65_55_1124]PIY51663.1 MAG: response regulator [Zetaproteobacteria bacterium CG_4_10_14_0_8_um_filter_55_43]PIZ39836.1 MAG: response regulator [Zetaproteobacteria bacterium CG_4_10_14_0_2_um_filter_55_20]PJB80936.1 MAG: response regulator [Zetaproteobacteria bacterium CG_4_9_14_0_8_um_filter_55_31]